MNVRMRMIYRVLNMYERKKGYLWLPGMTVYCNRWLKQPHTTRSDK